MIPIHAASKANFWRSFSLFSFLLLDACASAPTRYYSLIATASGTTSSGSGTQRAVVLTRTSIPDVADRMQLVVRESPTRVQIIENDQWAQPLRDQIPEVLLRDLRIELGNPNVVTDVRLAGSATPLSVVVDIEQFDALAGHEATIRARWAISSGIGSTPLIGDYTSVQPLSGSDLDSLVLVWSRGLAEISTAIANATIQYPSPQ